jgi:hypothetical protein
MQKEEVMKHDLSAQVQKELDSLDYEKKERVLRYIQREEEVGRFPSDKELLDIIFYLKSKVIKESRKQGVSVDIASGETVALNYERIPKDYLKLFNCTYCLHFSINTCNNAHSLLYNQKTNEYIVCAYFTERK